MQDWLALAAQQHPSKPALLIADAPATYHQLSYEQMNHRVAQLAHWLHTQGVREGDHVAVLLPNSTLFIDLIHALIRLKAVLVPLNLRLTCDEIRFQIEKAECQHLLHSASHSDLVDQLGFTGKTLNLESYHADETVDIRPFLDGEINLNALHALIFTSGTSGRPKAAQISYGNHYFSAMASQERLGAFPEERWLLCLPLYHVGGIAVVLRSAIYATAIVELQPQKLNIEGIAQAMNLSQTTMVSLVPTQLYRLLRGNFALPSSLRMILLGGAAAPPDLLAETCQQNIPVATTYGLTEASSQVATMLPDAVCQKRGSIGKPLNGTSIRIVDREGNTLPHDEIGEIVIAGPTVMQGYWKEPQQTALRDGELFTGDLGYLDADEDLWLVQRRSDLIVSGGENIYPVEVENQIRCHVAVDDVAVVGIPHSEWGQQVAALICLKPDATLTPDALILFLRGNLARYKLPRKIIFTPAMPLTGSGKIDRAQVRKQLETTDRES